MAHIRVVSRYQLLKTVKKYVKYICNILPIWRMENVG
jgi:hypothetical protein